MYFNFSNLPSSFYDNLGRIEYALKVFIDKEGEKFDKKVKLPLSMFNPQYCIDEPRYEASTDTWVYGNITAV